jgi:hypothetical protein
LPMRKIIAIVALLCGATGAYAAEPQKWCSFGEQAVLTLADNKLSLTVAGKPMPVDPAKDVIEASITISPANGPINAMLVKDRVFWPCKD